MLRRLYIKDFILIEEVNIDFKGGFSVFTGETGAGKSIFIDCVSILIGERMNTSMIRTGTSKAVIEGEFDIDDNITSKLEQSGYKSDCLIISREINTDGRSSTKVNGRNATVGFIKELLKEYVDIHCQHDNQYLMNEKYHLDLLDSYSNNNEKLLIVKELFNKYHQLLHDYEYLLNNEFNEAQLDILRYQLSEIDKLHLRNGEEEEIQSVLKAYNEKEKLQQSLDRLKELFDNDNGILSNLYDFTKLSSSLSEYSEIKDHVESINNAYYSISEDYDAIVRYLGNDDIDINTVDELNSRLFEIQRIKRKYNSTVSAILQKADEIRKQLKSVEDRDVILADMRDQMNKEYSRFEKEALELREIRQNAAVRLENSILDELKDLNMDKARFKVEFEERDAYSKGLDTVRFLISINPGQPLRELSTVASGGELSRLMLGMKTIFTRLQGSKLVIFDEIDAGVSGYVAFNIGKKMYDISRDTQVFSVTHLASVAAHGDYHYHISKQDDNVTTRTNVELLNTEERIRELAIISSSNITDSSLNAARELLEKAKSSHK